MICCTASAASRSPRAASWKGRAGPVASQGRPSPGSPCRCRSRRGSSPPSIGTPFSSTPAGTSSCTVPRSPPSGSPPGPPSTPGSARPGPSSPRPSARTRAGVARSSSRTIRPASAPPTCPALPAPAGPSEARVERSRGCPTRARGRSRRSRTALLRSVTPRSPGPSTSSSAVTQRRRRAGSCAATGAAGRSRDRFHEIEFSHALNGPRMAAPHRHSNPPPARESTVERVRCAGDVVAMVWQPALPPSTVVPRLREIEFFPARNEGQESRPS